MKVFDYLNYQHSRRVKILASRANRRSRVVGAEANPALGNCRSDWVEPDDAFKMGQSARGQRTGGCARQAMHLLRLPDRGFDGACARYTGTAGYFNAAQLGGKHE